VKSKSGLLVFLLRIHDSAPERKVNNEKKAFPLPLLFNTACLVCYRAAAAAGFFSRAGAAFA
jgi:hypothetical protein